jgi:hypothetical protein
MRHSDGQLSIQRRYWDKECNDRMGQEFKANTGKEKRKKLFEPHKHYWGGEEDYLVCQL